jgi:hypothetical protein
MMTGVMLPMREPASGERKLMVVVVVMRRGRAYMLLAQIAREKGALDDALDYMDQVSLTRAYGGLGDLVSHTCQIEDCAVDRDQVSKAMLGQSWLLRGRANITMTTT